MSMDHIESRKRLKEGSEKFKAQVESKVRVQKHKVRGYSRSVQTSFIVPYISNSEGYSVKFMFKSKPAKENPI